MPAPKGITTHTLKTAVLDRDSRCGVFPPCGWLHGIEIEMRGSTLLWIFHSIPMVLCTGFRVCSASGFWGGGGQENSCVKKKKNSLFIFSQCEPILHSTKYSTRLLKAHSHISGFKLVCILATYCMVYRKEKKKVYLSVALGALRVMIRSDCRMLPASTCPHPCNSRLTSSVFVRTLEGQWMGQDCFESGSN